MTRLEARGLCKSYRAAKAVDEFTHSFTQGKITVLLGPSGSGKSTTLNLIAGLVEPDRGSIFLNDRNITSWLPEKRNFGMIFQNYRLFPHLTVQENVGFGLRVRGMEKKERIRRTRETMELTRIAQLANRRINGLSGGEQQRVAVARAVAYRPEVLLMDEPLSALDAPLRAELRKELAGLLQALAITTVYVTHDQEEAMGLGDEIVILNKGSIEQRGLPRDIYIYPANSTVAKFLGQANIYRARCTRKSDRWKLRVAFADWDLAEGVEGECQVMFRPEDIELVERGLEDFTAETRGVTFLGDRLRIDLASGAEQIVMETPNDIRVGLSEKLLCRIKPGRLRIWFDGVERPINR
jgi:putative spermidine/putrescine transport system ATP-binding protein